MKLCQHLGILSPFNNCQILHLFEIYLLCVAAANGNFSTPRRILDVHFGRSLRRGELGQVVTDRADRGVVSGRHRWGIRAVLQM